MTTTLSFPGLSLPDPFDLPESVLGHYDLFSHSLDSLASFNPFRTPSAPPGSRALTLEQRLVSREEFLARGAGLSPAPQTLTVHRRQILGALKRLLAATTLLQHERFAVLVAVADFLHTRDLADLSARPAPDPDLFLDNLRRALSLDFLLPAPDVRRLLHDICRLALPFPRAA